MELKAHLLKLAAERSRSAAGAKLNGIVHNLNNPVHALTMQAELLQKTLEKANLEALRPNLLEKCARLHRIARELKSHLEVLFWRDAYVNPDRQLLDPVHFGTWLLQFWQGDQRFKHKISPTLCTDPPPPHVQTIPLVLTWCLEEPLRALLNALNSPDIQGAQELILELGPLPGSGLMVHLASMPQTGGSGSVHAPIRHATELQDLTAALGWDWQAGWDQGRLTVRLEIPGKPHP